ncbi:MAG: decarboxylase [Crocinitomicaceae bacterium]|nr:decarboxylase [Crocinitomicaceae bacterium]
MRFLTFLFLIPTLFACNESSKEKPTTTAEIKKEDENEHPKHTANLVHYEGALKAIMHEGDLSAKAYLKDHEMETDFYALGALKDLKGEILIWNSQPIISTYEKDKLIIDSTFNHEATLFVYSNVNKWQSIAIPSEIKTSEELEIFIEKTAHEKGLDIEKAFPFLIKGPIKELDWHVINWPEGDTEHSHEKHVSSGKHGEISNENVEILGFYSKHHHTIFTHHTTNMHMHFRSQTLQLAGQVDAMLPGEKMTLELPLTE